MQTTTGYQETHFLRGEIQAKNKHIQHLCPGTCSDQPRPEQSFYSRLVFSGARAQNHRAVTKESEKSKCSLLVGIVA